MPNNYVIRPYQQGDEEEIVELLELVFDGWPRFDLNCTPLDHWKWKYLDNPFRANHINVAVSDEKIIGCCHSIPKNIKIGNKVFLGSIGGDSAVHPDFRKMGIYDKMNKLRSNLRKKGNVKFVTRISNNPILIKYQSQRFPRFPHTINNLIRIRDIDIHLKMKQTKNQWIKKNGFLLLKLFNKITNSMTIFDTKVNLDNIHISEIQNFDDRINPFWNDIKEKTSYIVERTKDHLNWRYCDPRGGDYLIKIAEDNNQILGYIVLRINRYDKDYPIGYIVDLLTSPEQLFVTKALVSDALQYFEEHNVNLVNVWSIQNHYYNSIFKRYGFIKDRRRLNFFYTMLDILDGEIRQINTDLGQGIFFSYGDFDGI